jgi:glycosyltransferase involved in cell wall biosynthesis
VERSRVRFVVLSFEGPDRYSLAGGLGSRVSGLTRSLARLGFETHLFFIGDPAGPGHERKLRGHLHLHRWCQWISRYHPDGVYDGEEFKRLDWNRSLPPWLMENVLEPAIEAGDVVVILAEEWHTAETMIGLREMVSGLGWEERVRLFWNANNVFGFHRIDWGRLRAAATITTVSRYMKHVVGAYGVDARVVPNGISESWLRGLPAGSSAAFPWELRERPVLVKVARWDPDKRWDTAVEAVDALRREGQHPLFLARGGPDSGTAAVVDRAEQAGLRVARAHWKGDGIADLADAIAPHLESDMIVLDGFLTRPQCKALYRGADAVLANSGLEPFGLVGLETMAAGGVAFVGCTGEDYVTHGHDAISIQSHEPREIAHYVRYLRSHGEEASRIRRAGRHSARRYVWMAVPLKTFFLLLEEEGVPVREKLIAKAAAASAGTPP